MEEWISLQEFMKRKKIGQQVAYQLLESGKYEYEKTNGGRYKIKVGGDMVSRQLYEETLQRAVRAETKLENIQAVLNLERRKNE